ncbi:MAG: hypothetical protein CSA62_07505 [Planctomycetota bacterium]|nr:MAG: hypothetical protein CSA62_07505 [Planctomycetota bacterium]
MKLHYFGIVLATILAATLAAYVPPKGASAPPEGSIAPQHYYAILPILLIAVLGFLIRRHQKHGRVAAQAGSDGAKFASTAQEIQTGITRIRALLDSQGANGSATARSSLDQMGNELVAPLIEARHGLALELGLGPFADKMSQFARGERALHRAWSALTDGNLEEARMALKDAEALFGAIAADASTPATAPVS